MIRSNVSEFVFFHGLFILLLHLAYASNGNICDGIQALHEDIDRGCFATKTGYQDAPKPSQFAELFNEEVTGGTCSGEAVQLWLITRHGTRYPTKAATQKMEAILPLLAQEIVFNNKEGRGCLTEREAEELKNWYPPFSARDAAQLQETGADEQYRLGQMWKRLYPDLLGPPYSQQLYKVEVTTANRTSQSAYHFLRGLFGDDQAARIKLPRPRSINWKLRAYNSCPVWKRDVVHNPATLNEQRLYEQQREFKDTVIYVSLRLGYTEPISVDELSLVYDECRFELAWWPERRSVWCKAFTPHDLKVLEYHQALRYYYVDSYGAPDFTPQMACAAVADIVVQMSTAVKGGGAPRALLYFSHDHHMLQLQTLLGLHRPVDHLVHDNRMMQQQFNISSISPFSGNLAFILYRCSDGGHRVGALQQGAPITLSPVCPGAGSVTCPWPVEALQAMADSCRVRQVCAQHDEL